MKTTEFQGGIKDRPDGYRGPNGSAAVLVVDAGINGAVSLQIQEIVTKLTDKPLRYLVNTTYHGDHTFGNYAFSRDVVIMTSVANRASMSDLDVEKTFRRANLYGKRRSHC
jgi:cyclase